jgi:uncharacterized membrane protein YkoI
MRKRIIVTSVLVVLLVLAGATLAFGGPSGLIWDDGHYAKPGSLDDGKDMLSQTKVTLAEANAAAKRAASGQLGQVDLEHYENRLVYSVDVGDNEVKVDAGDGSIAGIVPRD